MSNSLSHAPGRILNLSTWIKTARIVFFFLSFYTDSREIQEIREVSAPITETVIKRKSRSRLPQERILLEITVRDYRKYCKGRRICAADPTTHVITALRRLPGITIAGFLGRDYQQGNNGKQSCSPELLHRRRNRLAVFVHSRVAAFFFIKSININLPFRHKIKMKTNVHFGAALARRTPRPEHEQTRKESHMRTNI